MFEAWQLLESASSSASDVPSCWGVVGLVVLTQQVGSDESCEAAHLYPRTRQQNSMLGSLGQRKGLFLCHAAHRLSQIATQAMDSKGTFPP